MAVLAVAYGLAMGLCLCFALFTWNEVRYRRKCLPPGTMGWPIVGETTEFLKQGPSFLKNKRARYGSFFKTHILGSPTIISMDPDVNRHILLSEGKGLVPGYPKSMVDIIGNSNIAAVHGSAHKNIRGSLLSLIGPGLIKDRLLPNINKVVRSHLDCWDGKTIDMQEKTTKMALLTSLRQIMELESTAIYESFESEFDTMLLGTLALPINFPGSNYRRGLLARKNVIRTLRQIMKERRASSTYQNDMLGYMLRNEDSRHNLNDEEIIDQMITILNSGYETVSRTSMMAVKYLHDHPKALEELREEHLTIRERKMPDEPIYWDDYKTMKFTRAVIFETLRLATVINGVLRKTTQEMELNGFVIPKGWRIYVYTREINYDPFLYPEPLTFNPWRWLDKRLESHDHFFFFGGGSRLCPGKELGITKVAVFLHYLVTRYRWEEVAENEIQKFPRVEAPNGLHMKLSKY
ncbi:cytochrome P450 85A-like [Malania oleifera]|uniref:cytochrome P450 85A-like n=1 Tax=Malania oleifera TaxID=397392 RepID=UPI0025AEA3E9|nr:cytochrome P450 85A-like [Malania oleifera]